MSTHAPLAPSSAFRVVACPGSADVEAMYPDEETIDNRQGDAVHWAGAQLLNNEMIALGQVADNGEVLNVEMVEAAEAYAGHIVKRDGDYWGWCNPSIEHTITVTPIHPDNWGTPDYFMYNHEDNHLFVDDLKYGHGFVSEVRNWQLVNYAALAACELGRYHDDSLLVTMTIHQPRCYHRRGHVRSWTATLGELRQPIAELSAAFMFARSEEPPCMARDPDACRDCKGRHGCEALAMVTGPGVDLAYSTAPLKMSPAAMKREYQRLAQAEKFIAARRKGIEQSLLSAIQRGGIVPGFRIAHGAGRRVWRDDAMQNDVVGVAKAFNANIEKPSLITPLQAIKAGVPEDVIKLYSHTPGGAAELVEDDETAAANIFSK